MNNLTVTEFKNIRVLTTQQLAEGYETTTDTITKNFNRNKERYIEGKHFICLEGEELKAFKTNGQIDLSLKLNKLYLWTEKGAFLHAKSLNTDKAWEVYDILVDTYFKKPMTNIELIELQLRAIREVDSKADLINDDLQTFKKDMPLLALECQKITRAKNRKIVPLMGGKNSAAYKDNKLRGKVYRDLENQIYRQFGVDTYKAIKRSECDKAIEIINNYELPLVLETEIFNCNAQISLGA